MKINNRSKGRLIPLSDIAFQQLTVTQTGKRSFTIEHIYLLDHDSANGTSHHSTPASSFNLLYILRQPPRPIHNFAKIRAKSADFDVSVQLTGPAEPTS
jgi:hypothetical protein